MFLLPRMTVAPIFRPASLVLSQLQSSYTSISSNGIVCLCADASSLGRHHAALYAGIARVTVGGELRCHILSRSVVPHSIAISGCNPRNVAGRTNSTAKAGSRSYWPSFDLRNKQRGGMRQQKADSGTTVHPISILPLHERRLHLGCHRTTAVGL